MNTKVACPNCGSNRYLPVQVKMEMDGAIAKMSLVLTSEHPDDQGAFRKIFPEGVDYTLAVHGSGAARVITPVFAHKQPDEHQIKQPLPRTLNEAREMAITMGMPNGDKATEEQIGAWMAKRAENITKGVRGRALAVETSKA